MKGYLDTVVDLGVLVTEGDAPRNCEAKGDERECRSHGNNGRDGTDDGQDDRVQEAIRVEAHGFKMSLLVVEYQFEMLMRIKAIFYALESQTDSF